MKGKILSIIICLMLAAILLSSSLHIAHGLGSFSSGFETGDTSEWETTSDTPEVAAGYKRSGSYGCQFQLDSPVSYNEYVSKTVAYNVFSATAFVRWEAFVSYYMTVMCVRDASRVDFTQYAGHLIVSFGAAKTDVLTLTLSQWYNLTITFDGATITWLVDSVEKHTESYSYGSQYLLVGIEAGNPSTSYKVWIDDCSITEGETTPTEDLVNVYASPSGVGSVTFTIDSSSHSTPYSENLAVGSHTFIRSLATKTISSTVVYGFEKWMVTNSSGTFNFTTASITLDIQTETNLTLVYSTIQINIASSPEIYAGFKVDGTYSFVTPKTLYRNKGSHTFLCTTFQYYPNSSYVYTFDHWTVNGSGNYGSLSLTLDFQDDTDLTMVYVGSVVSPPFPYVYARGALNATWYMRSDTHTIHAVYGFKLLTVNTQTPWFDSRIELGSHNVSYGVRVWAIDFFNHTYELTSGSPVAIVTKSDTGGEMLVGYWNCPAYNSMIDSIMVKVYQKFDDTEWSPLPPFVTGSDLLIRLPASTWTFHYYVIRTVGSTNSTFGFGSYTTYNSRINLQYYKASPWDVALARLWQRDFIKFMFTPWTYWLGDLFWTVVLFGCIVMAYLRTGSLKPILGLLWILGGSGSILWALIPAAALHVAVLMLAVAMAITYFRLVYK
jgi:hypothetical protein